MRSGWGFPPGRRIGYLPLGDGGMFDWRDASQEDWPAIRRVLERKVEAEELVGIHLRWSGADVGATFLLYPDSSITASLDACRPRLEGCEPITDYNWFLRRILAPLIAAGWTVADVECHDHAS